MTETSSARAALALAIHAARRAGSLLAQAFHDHGADPKSVDFVALDHQVERELRAILQSHTVRWPVLGEEQGFEGDGCTHDGHVWVVDPHDGTASAQAGWRGPSVSIALLQDGVPVLGVVFAYAAPDDDGDLLAWAEGVGPLTRNGHAVVRAPLPAELSTYSVLAVSQDAVRHLDTEVANALVASPARILPVPGIAWRVARVAAGDADAAVSLGGASSWDIAAAHALMRAVGGGIFREDGSEVTYGPLGACTSPVDWSFACAPALAPRLTDRPWAKVFRPEGFADTSIYRPRYVGLHPHKVEAGVLRRAQGAMLGQLCGDALGSLVEFQPEGAIRQGWPGGPREILNGGTWDTLAGQPTDDSEMALCLARAIVARQGFDAEEVARAYANWYASGPFDIGNTTQTALAPAWRALQQGTSALDAARTSASTQSQANGGLMRISPLGILGWAAPAQELAAWARADASITHPNPICQDASQLFAVTLAHAIATGAGPREVYDFACDYARGAALDPLLQGWLGDAQKGAPHDMMQNMGWLRLALHNAFYQLLHARNFEEGVVDTVARGGDTDTNAAIAGALLGAVHGRNAVPGRWTRLVETCRPAKGLPGLRRPRPAMFWPTDALRLAEELLALGGTLGVGK